MTHAAAPIRRALTLLATPILALAGLTLTAQPAAAATYIDICVSSSSDTGVYAKSLTTGYSVYVGPNGCAYNLVNSSNQIRVNVITSGSFKKTEAGAGWNVECHGAPNANSNPFGTRMYYRTYNGENC